MKNSGFDGEGYAIVSGRIGVTVLGILIAVIVGTLCKLGQGGGHS